MKLCPDCGRTACLIFQWAEARRRSMQPREVWVTPRAAFHPPLVGTPVVPGIVHPPDPVPVLSMEPFEPSYVSVPADYGAIRANSGRRAGTPSAESSDPPDGP
jgi:hypothetical protein